ncbi:glycosyltransferase [Ponticoccus alexandrii]|uniref:glycosyltransferase n=1 Tax=Ponticoccus alexandrii TaxID=1943633 RepID=UPI0003D1B0A4|nr:glycosyltransferase [Ponticoccus alexandrii]
MEQGTGQGGTDRRRLVAVVVTYNRLAQLKVTLSRLLAVPPADLAAVVVVDNASTDGTGDWLQTQHDSRLDLRPLPDNRGGAGGFEAGMKAAMADHAPDWIVVMDDDARPQEGALAAFHAMDLDGWDAAAAAVFFPDGRICEMNRPSRNPFWHLPIFLRTVFRVGRRSGFHLGAPDYAAGAAPIRIDITSFVGFFVSATMVEKIGYPDPSLFVYGDDGIYTLGLSRAGGRIGFLPSVRFEHDCSTLSDDGRFRPLWKVYYYHRNLLILYRLAAGWIFWPLLLVVLPKWLWKGRAHGGQRRAFYRLLGRAIRDGLLGTRGVPHREILKLAE